MKNKQLKSKSISKNSSLSKSIVVAALLAMSGSLFCQAPTLGITANFAAFTAGGAFISLNTTKILGNVGTNVGEFSGIPPGIVIGEINVADAVSAQAAIDVERAYSDLLSTECGVVLGTTMGNGQVLTPEVYCLGDISTLEGDLTFDGLGNENAIFIVKINGAFATSQFSNIHLINSASAFNIYWQINGQFTLGESSLFKGTVITDGAIILLNAAIIDGRLLSKAGAISLNNNIVNLPSNETILPVELISFNVEIENQEVILYWNTASELNNKNFTVESSEDGILWKVLGNLEGAGNTPYISNYSYVDEHPYPFISYYRLKQTDFDQNFSYSSIVTLDYCDLQLAELYVYPNPVSNILFLDYNGNSENIISIIVYNSSGQSVYYSSNYQTTLDLSDCSDGIYFLHFNHSSATIIERIIISK